MKISKKFLSLVFLFTFSCHAQVGSTPVGIRDVQYAIAISQARIANGTTFIISEPGYYLLSQDLSFIPDAANDTVIRISSSSVTLDLNTYRINSDKSQSGTIAISVDSGLSSIIIKNGIISSMTGNGIKINTGCTLVKFYDLFIDDCDAGGILLDTTGDMQFNFCRISSCNGAATSTEAFGLKILSSKDVVIENSIFNTNSSLTIPAVGAIISDSINCKFISCETVANSGTSGYGFRLQNCTACVLQNCVATDNLGATSNGFGFSLESCLNTAITNCKARSNQSTALTAYGFYLSESKYNLFQECEGTNQFVSTSTSNAFGFFSRAGEGNNFFKCTAIGNIGGSAATSTGAGFSLNENERSSIIECCKSTNNNGGTGEGYGIRLGSSTSGDVTINCTVQQNQFSGNTGGSKRYGYKDFSANSTTFLNRNLAFSQGKVKTAATIVDTGTMNYMFTYTDPRKNPFEIIVETNIAMLKPIDTSAPFDNISIIVG